MYKDMKKKSFSYCMIAFLLAITVVSCSKSPDYLGKYEVLEVSFLNDDKEQAPADDSTSMKLLSDVLLLQLTASSPDDVFPMDMELTDKAIITNVEDTTECRYEVVNDTLVHIFMKGEKDAMNLVLSEQPCLQKGFLTLKLRKKTSEK